MSSWRRVAPLLLVALLALVLVACNGDDDMGAEGQTEGPSQTEVPGGDPRGGADDDDDDSDTASPTSTPPASGTPSDDDDDDSSALRMERPGHEAITSQGVPS